MEYIHLALMLYDVSAGLSVRLSVSAVEILF